MGSPKFASLWLALLTIVAGHATAPAQTVDQHGLVMPPARYASGPFLYPVKTHRLSTVGMRQACVNVVPTKGAYAAPELGCSVVGPVRCDIYLPQKRTIPKTLANHIVLHELAHCRGWPGDHPD